MHPIWRKVHILILVINVKTHLDLTSRRTKRAEVGIACKDFIVGGWVGNAGDLPVALPANREVDMVDWRVAGIGRIGLCCIVENTMNYLLVCRVDPQSTGPDTYKSIRSQFLLS
jgi:hypothetical protein